MGLNILCIGKRYFVSSTSGPNRKVRLTDSDKWNRRPCYNRADTDPDTTFDPDTDTYL